MNRLTGITARLKQAATRRREGQHMWGASLRLMAGLAAAIVVGTCLLLLPGIGVTRPPPPQRGALHRGPPCASPASRSSPPPKT